MNSQRSLLVDLAQVQLPPAAQGCPNRPVLAPEDMVLYELHVRDFSINDATVPAADRGTFKAFTDTSSNGMKHLAALQAAGLTHVHLLPAFDFASVDEDKTHWQTPNVPNASPDSDQQQAAVMATADEATAAAPIARRGPAPHEPSAKAVALATGLTRLGDPGSMLVHGWL